MRRNADTILEFSNARPFRWRQRNFFCAYCELEFPDTDRLLLHTVECRRRRGGKLVEKTRRGEPLKIDVTDLKCVPCDEAQPNLEHFKLHLGDAHGKKIDACGDGVIPYKLNAGDIACLVCMQKFDLFSKLNSHINAHYPKYVCEVCGRCFASPSRVRSHIQVHMRGNFSCKQCNAVFTKASQRNSHRLKAHCQNKYTCPRCDLRLHSYSERTKHLIAAHGIKPAVFQCNVCPKKLESCDARARHIKNVHSNVRDYKCTHCPTKLQTHAELLRHESGHTGRRVFECASCDRAYTSVRNLRAHARLHKEERFVCSVCQQRFVHKCSLKRHLQSKHSGAAVK